MSTRPLSEGDRVAVKFSIASAMGYFMGYYNDNYVICVLDSDDGEPYTFERHRVSKAPTDPPPVANIQIIEATAPAPTTTNKED